MSDQDEIVEAIRERLEAEHGCHTVILYGSRARGDANIDSDYDIVAFRDGDRPPLRETGYWRGALLDTFIYSTERLETVDETLLHIRGGRVLTERGTLATQFLAELERLYSQPPAPLSDDAIDARRNWARKMLQRAGRGDVEGNFRRVWLLTQLLEDYFAVRARRYPGPKEAFCDIARSDPEALELFQVALEPGATLVEISAVAAKVHNGLPDIPYQ